MKSKILTLIIGILIGAIIATSGFLIYEKTTADNAAQNPQVQQQGGEEGEAQMSNGEEPPSKPEGEAQTPDGEEPPSKPDGDDSQAPADMPNNADSGESSNSSESSE